jgi:hypothetical protein
MNEHPHPAPYAVGDRVVVTDSRTSVGAHCIGETATVTHVGAADAPYPYLIEFDDTDVDANPGSWSHAALDPADDSADLDEASMGEVYDESAPGRPLVHFDDDLAGRDRSKARAACGEAVSKSLKPEHNTRLRNAAAGESVDAYDLNEAITAAIRSAATRKASSSQRRDQATRFAHVAHIVQAVLENHADNLPAYAEGQRSRLLEDAKEGLEAARLEIESLTAQYKEVAMHRASMAQERAEAQRNLRIANRTIESRDAIIANLNARLAEFEERARFTESLLDDAGQNKVLGWRYGYAAGKDA